MGERVYVIEGWCPESGSYVLGVAASHDAAMRLVGRLIGADTGWDLGADSGWDRRMDKTLFDGTRRMEWRHGLTEERIYVCETEVIRE